MTKEEAIEFLNKMTQVEHEKSILDECVETLKDMPDILIHYSSLLALYSTKDYGEAVNNILYHEFALESDKMGQLELLSSLSYSNAAPSVHLPKILPNNRSIAFEIAEKDYDSYSLLLEHLPHHYKCETKPIGRSRLLIAIYYNK